MNLRVSSEQLRFRLNADEWQKLIDEKKLTQPLWFQGKQQMHMSVELGSLNEGEKLQVDWNESEISLFIDLESAQHLSSVLKQSKPKKDDLMIQQVLSEEGKGIEEVDLEVDYFSARKHAQK